MRPTVLACAAFLAATHLTHAPLAAQPGVRQPSKPAAKQPQEKPATYELLNEHVSSRVDSILKVLDDNGDFVKAGAQLQELFDQCVAYAPDLDHGRLIIIDAPLRMIQQLLKCPEGTRRARLAYLRKHPALAQELAFVLTTADNYPAAYGVLDRLREAAGDKPGEYPALVAAICAVYDRPHAAAATGKHGVPSANIDPVEVFGHFVAHEGRMVFGLNSLSPECLAFMVSTTAAPDELEWAFRKHAGDRSVGKRYHDIVYDTAFFKYNKPKKIDAFPYSLQNIARQGGVCVEQAYYAAHAAKAIGVPATVIGGRTGDMGHAWVGFLQLRGGGPAWNTDEGHYDDYENTEGSITDPLTGRKISDTWLAMTAESVRLPLGSRLGAVALTDAARRLAHLYQFGEKAKAVYPPHPIQGIPGLREQPRALSGPTRMEILQAAVALASRSPDVWTAVAEAAPDMAGSDRQAWFDLLTNSCGQQYRRFAYHITAAMIDGIADAQEASGCWDWAFKTYRLVPDLAADARMRQGKKWEAAGNPDRAFAAYTDVVRNFPNDGPFVLDALGRAEAMLRKVNNDGAIVDLYRDAFRRISRPDNNSANFFRGSNFFRVGMLYAAALERVGRTNDAKAVMSQLSAGIEKK